MISTLAHEFQHMIHFYQKYIARNATSDEVWEDEMASMMIEDLLADKLNTKGPRGVTPTDYSDGSTNNEDGRIPSFNYRPTLTVAEQTYFSLDHYSSSYAYGAYLLRNFGGSTFLRNMVQNGYGNADAVSEALQGYDETYASTLRKFASAVVLSDHFDLTQGYKFNSLETDPFVSTINGISYQLGSINFYNYDQFYSANTGPRFDNSSLSEYINKSSSFIYTLGNLSGSVSLEVSLPSGVELNIVGK